MANDRGKHHSHRDPSIWVAEYLRVFKSDTPHPTFVLSDLDGWEDLTEMKHKFALSQKGHMGWVPLCCQPGDSICIFFRGKISFVVRKVDEQSHILLGPAYIEGLMYGEALKWEELEPQKVTLV